MITTDDLRKLIQKPGYSIKSCLGKGAIGSAFGGKGKDPHLEQSTFNEPLRAEAVSLNYTGKCVIRIRFYRRRLADYSRAISEKAIIDALVYGGAIRDDSEKEILLIDEGQFKVESDAEERTELTLEYADFDFIHPFVPRKSFGNAGKKDL